MSVFVDGLLRGKVEFVTGGGSGIGAGIAKRLAKQGAKVALLGRTLEKLEQERSLLERKIDELRVFERDYRTRLKSYLENLLGDLDARGASVAPRAASGGEQLNS